MRPATLGMFSLVLLAAVSGSCSPPPVTLPSATYKSVQGPYAVGQEVRTWYDARRRRDVPVRIYLPEAVGEIFPVIIFSHGLGASRDEYAYLGEHWASCGYVCVHLTHLGTDYSAIFADGQVVANLLEFADDPYWRTERPADVSFALDQLADHYLFGRLVDMERVGVAGHSLGAYTALAVIGLRVDLPGQLATQFIDPRIKAAVAMSPPGQGALGLRDDAWADLRVPCLSMIGTRDWDPATADPLSRRIVFTQSEGPDQFLLTLDAATHGTFTDSHISPTDRLSHERYYQYVQMVGTAFFDAYLKGDPAAQEWLLSDAALLPDGSCRLEWKNVTPLAQAPRAQGFSEDPP